MRTLLSNERRLKGGPANLGSNMLTYLFVIVMFFTKPKIVPTLNEVPCLVFSLTHSRKARSKQPLTLSKR